MTTTPHLGLTKDSPTGEKYSVVRVNDNSDRIDEYCYENRTRIVALETAQEQMAGALADKIEIGDVFGIPKDITASDLDDLTEIGIHQTDGAGAVALAHSPITTGFYLRVFVMELATDTWYRQELVPKNAPRVTYMRHLHVGVGWTAWQHTGILDSAPTENSTNPVTSGGVYPVAVKAVDEGAKNVANWSASTQTINNVVFAVSGDTVTATLSSGTQASARSQKALDLASFDKLTAGTYVITGAPTMSGGGLYVWDGTAAARVSQSVRTEGGAVEFDFSPVSGHQYNITVDIPNGYTIASGDALIFRPMICTAADWAVSQKIVPYCPTMQEMYQMILQMQSGGNRSLSVQPEEKEVETDAGNSDQNQR